MRTHHSDLVYSASFSPDGRRIVTASRDHSARLWDAETGKDLRVFIGHQSDVRGASFSADGRRILTRSDDGTARVWNAETGQQLIALTGHEGSVTSASFSADGVRIMTASRDGTARVWDATNGASLLSLQGHTGAVVSAAFSSDGSRVATASADKTARLWSLSRKLGTPIVQGIASSSTGALWVVGSDGYAAHSRGGRSWTLVRPDDETDLFAVAAIGAETGIALTGNNKLVVLNEPDTSTRGQGAGQNQLTPQQRQQGQVGAAARGQTRPIPDSPRRHPSIANAQLPERQ